MNIIHMDYVIIVDGKGENTMARMTKCRNCGSFYKNKRINFLLLIILLCLGIFPGVLYFLFRKNKCPGCGMDN